MPTYDFKLARLTPQGFWPDPEVLLKEGTIDWYSGDYMDFWPAWSDHQAEILDGVPQTGQVTRFMILDSGTPIYQTTMDW